MRRSIPHAALGRVRLLAGDATSATPELARATRTCRVLAEPFVHTRAHAWLGEALEATGDKPGACAAYAVVAARWGSVTASPTRERAAHRSRALSCAK
jgi:serine/threonine-protein kinase